jgi:hypothetical protein
MLDSLRAHPDNPAVTCQVVLDRWRELLAPQRERLLSQSVLAGLLSELHVLESLATKSPVKALQAWTGPSGTRFDFNGPRTSIEAKATTTRERFLVEIHGAFQLQIPREQDLYLYAEQLEPSPRGDDSVPNAVARLREAGVAAHGLLSRLSDIGYLPVDEPAYEKVRFDLVGYRILRVDDTFPRIVPETLKDPSCLEHITRIRYTLDLTDSPSFSESVDNRDLLAAKMMEP